MPKREKIQSLGDYNAYLSRNEAGLPVALQIADANSSYIILHFDTADSMSFATLDERTPPEAVTLLAQTLKAHYGGKNMVCIPKSLASGLEAEGFHATPETPDGKPYDRMMVADSSIVRRALDKRAPGITPVPPLPEQFHLITDKNQLAKRASELSALFLKKYKRSQYEITVAASDTPLKANASFASDPKKEAQYSTEAIKARLSSSHASAAAIADASGKLVGFIRAFNEPGMGIYVSDLLIDQPVRQQISAKTLMKASLAALDDAGVDKKFWVIAGGPAETKLFNELGFTSVREKPVTMQDGKQFMFAMFQPKALQTDLQDEWKKTLVRPEPELLKLPQAGKAL